MNTSFIVLVSNRCHPLYNHGSAFSLSRQNYIFSPYYPRLITKSDHLSKIS